MHAEDILTPLAWALFGALVCLANVYSGYLLRIVRTHRALHGKQAQAARRLQAARMAAIEQEIAKWAPLYAAWNAQVAQRRVYRMQTPDAS